MLKCWPYFLFGYEITEMHSCFCLAMDYDWCASWYLHLHDMFILQQGKVHDGGRHIYDLYLSPVVRCAPIAM